MQAASPELCHRTMARASWLAAARSGRQRDARFPRIIPWYLMPIVACAAALLLSLSLPLVVSAQTPASGPPARETFTVRATTSPISVDGEVNEPAWGEAVNVPVAYEWSPGDNIPSPVKTDCLITYDAHNLYIAFRAFDPRPAEIRAHLMDRDDTDTLIQDDHIGVMIDTFNDERRAYQFRVNALGVQADAIFSEQDGIEDFSWDMIWKSVGRVTADGYIVEIALPLKQLRFPSGEQVHTWGFEAFRSWPRNVRHRMSSQRRDRNTACLLCQENKITGFNDLSQGRNLEFDPTATFARTERTDPNGGGSATERDTHSDAGLTARWSMTPSMTFSGTLNPDFSQVEADVAQLDVNQRFALFYPEKRPFFLEGIDFFSTPAQAVFTRTIADPYFGAKLTGKQGANAIGVFVTRDRINNLVFPSNQGSSATTLDDDVTSVVGRYRRDIGQGSTVGVLYAGREGDTYHNRQLGGDAFWRISQSDSLRVQLIRSDTQYPAATAAEFTQPSQAFAGNALYMDYLHRTRRWIANAFFESYDVGFRSDTGFIPRVDLRNGFGEVRRRWQRGAGAWFNIVDVGVRGWRTTDASWTLTDQTVAGFVNYTGPYQSEFVFNMPQDIVVFDGVRYEYLRPNFVVGIKPGGKTNVELEGRLGGGVDFANARAATSVVQLGPRFEYRPVARVSLSLQHDLDELSVEGGRLYRANLTQGKAIFHLNVHTFVRAILQYTDITRNPDLYTFPIERRSRRLFSQYLFSYKFNPQTVLFLGYSDNAIGTGDIDLHRQDRTFFVKLGYAWVM